MKRFLVFVFFIQCAAVTLASSPTDYFRSAQTGDWNLLSTWESSSDNINWFAATLVPDNIANTISIRNTHSVTISSSLTADQVVIVTGGTLINFEPAANIFTISNGSGDDLTIESGALYHILSTQGYASYQSLNANATIRVKTGGTIRLGDGSLFGGSNNHLLAATSASYIWENNSVFEWNSTGSFASSSITYFPDVDAVTIPVFRTMVNMGSVGAAAFTTFNGVFEANGTITFNNSGAKTFRNGIKGVGNITGATGAFIISGVTAVLGGSGFLTVPASGLDISAGATVTMISDKYVTGRIDLLGPNTHIELGAFNLTATTTVNITETSSWVKTNGTGKLTINSVSGPYPFIFKIFPVGLSTVNPLIMSSNSTANFSVRVDEPVIPAIFDPTRSVLRTWFITSSVTSPGATISFGYTHPGDAGINFVNSGLEVGVYIGGVWNVHQSGLNPSSFPFGTNTYTVTPSTLINYFTTGGPEIRFAIAVNGAILPLDFFINARAEKQNNSGIIKWKIYDETNTHSFEVQRSVDHSAYQTIATIYPSVNQLDYSYTDPVLEKGMNLFRIKVKRVNGDPKYSNTVALINDTKGLMITSISPNPVHTAAFIILSSAKPGVAHFEVYDMAGRKLKNWIRSISEGNNTIHADLTDLPGGVYQLLAFTSDSRSVSSFVK